MAHELFANTVVSIAEFKADPLKVVASGKGLPIAVLDRDEPAFYCVPAKTYETILELIDDAELHKIVWERANEGTVKVSLDQL